MKVEQTNIIFQKLDLYLPPKKYKMGINQLLKVLKSIAQPRHVSAYKNQTVAIDTYCWLHKGIYSCAQDLADGKQTDDHLQYCLRKVDMLLSYNIKVIMVFDGGKLPSKSQTEQDRERKRKDCLEKAYQYRLTGEKEKALQKFAESIDVTAEMAWKLIKLLKQKNIECIVAPFEADAQLAYLSIIDYVDIIITEDSDLLAFGAKKVLYKLNKNGEGQEIQLGDLDKCTEFNFQGWSQNQFLTFCILCGCDYLDSIPNVGYKTAYQQVQAYKEYRQTIDYFLRQSKFKVAYDYIERFEKAFLTFRFQKVYCPRRREIVTLNNLDLPQLEQDIIDKKPSVIEPSMMRLLKDGEFDMQFAGIVYEPQIAQDIADGLLNPFTLLSYQDKENQIQTQDFVQTQKRQVFKIQKKFCQIQNQEFPKLKQRTLDGFLVQQEEVLLNIVRKPSQMKPFKPPKFLSQDKEIEYKDRLITHSNENDSQMIIEKPVETMREEINLHSFSQEILNQKHFYNGFGEYLSKQIKFNKL